MPAASTSTRIPYDELPSPLQELLAPRVKRLGYLGEFFQCAAHQPEALAHFIHFTEALKEAVPFRLVEIIALTVATKAGNAYERVQHERLALTGGFTEDEVRDLVEARVSTSTRFTREEQIAAAFAGRLVERHGLACGAHLDELSARLGENVAAGCLMTAARYIAHAVMANAWELQPPVPSPLTHGTAE